MSGVKKIGLFGGTFDPVHKGHEKIIKRAFEQFCLDKIYLVVAGNPWMKKNKVKALYKHRNNMLQLAFKEEKRVEIIMLEPEEKPSYTYETIIKIESMHLKERLFLLAGADALKNFGKWKEARKILEKVVIVCADRDGIERKDIIKTLKKIHTGTRVEFFSNIKIDVASSSLRTNISRAFLSESVLKYIKENEVY